MVKVRKNNTNGRYREEMLLMVNSTDRERVGSKMLNFKTVIKSNGSEEPFEWEKLKRSVVLAGKDTKAYSKKDSKRYLIKY